MNDEDVQEEEIITYLSEDVELPNFNIHQNGKNWVNYGDTWRDNFGTRLMNYYNNSALHQAIIDSKAQQISGGGFLALDKDDNEIDLSMIVNKKGETLDDVNDKATKDKVIGGLGYVVLTWSNDWKTIADFNHYDFTKIRMAKVVDGQIPGVFYSFNWMNPRAKKFIPLWNPNKARVNAGKFKAYESELGKPSDLREIDKIGIEKGTHMQVLVFKNYDPDSFYYPYPSYKGALNAIEADIEADKYGMHSLKNGMNPSFIVNIKADPKDKVKGKIVRSFKKQYQGSKNAGEIVFTFTGKDDTPPEIIQLKAPDIDKRYVVINQNVQQKILSAHRVPNPILVGIMVPGKLGAINEIRDAQELFNNLVIKPEQKLIAKEFKKILPYLNELQSSKEDETWLAKVKKLLPFFKSAGPITQLSIKTNSPISFTWSEDVLKVILTTDEMRAEIGREPLEKEEVIEDKPKEEEVKMSKTESIKSFISGIFNKFKS